MELLRESVRLSLQDTKRHLRFSFTCPEGVDELLLDWRFSPAGAGELKTLVTLSLSGPGGFRGAGHRHGDHQQVRLGSRQATPGYLPGPIPAGEWTVTLHTHLVVDVTEGELSVVTLENVPDPLQAEPSSSEPPFPVALPFAALPFQTAWMMGDLHCHTQHSDGRWTPSELATAAAERGLSFLALTDHNTLSGRAELARHFSGLTLPGLELTTYYGHATVIGVPEYIDWTGLEPGQGMREVADDVTRQGAQLTIAHPFAAGDPVCTGCAWTTFDLRPETTTHMEVWNGPWAGRHNERALKCWYSLLASGKRVVATVGTDAHGPAYLRGVGFTCTPSTDDPEVLLGQLRAGLTYLSGSAELEPTFLAPDGPVPLGGEGQAGLWEASLAWTDFPAGSVLTFVVDGERYSEVLTSADRLVRRFEVRHWLNLELRNARGEMLALTNPGYARHTI
ncbi:CehA/McbA family metallohydrolase [Deinococcus sp. UYEF24]